MNYAEIVVNIEAPLEGTYHYSVPRDMRRYLKIGHLVEIEFGRRAAQGIVISFADDLAALTNTDEEFDASLVKPILSTIHNDPVVNDWQIELARWMSSEYLAPLNGCLRLFLPPGLTRWSDVTIQLNRYWDGAGRLTSLQKKIVELLGEHGDLRGKKLRPLLPKSERKKWQTAVNQLAKRNIVNKASVLDPPRLKPKAIKTAELIARPEQIAQKLPEIGRKSKQADILMWLLLSGGPTPSVEDVLEGTGREQVDFDKCLKGGLVELRKLGGFLPEEGGGNGVEQRTTRYVALTQDRTSTIKAILKLKKGESYGRIIDYLVSEARPVSVAEIYGGADANLTQLKKLAKWDIIKFGAEEVWRDSMADRDFTPAEPPRLTQDQARIWGRLKVEMIGAGIEPEFDEDEDFDDWDDDPPSDEAEEDETVESKPFLLHGVTGSGKTEIYMRAIDHALEAGRTAIVLVPEIALTPQTVRRFAARFPGRVAVMHSRLSDGERYDTWRRARQGLFDIVVGPRSALFVPLQNLGVIVLDEEHDNSYKQTPPVPAPYYHAREVAIQLGQITGAAVVLGSATPDVVTYHKARADEYTLLELPRRVMGHRLRIESQAERLQLQSHYSAQEGDPDDALMIPLPPIKVVDLRQELRAGNRSIFSRALEKAMDETLARGEQAILFLNRRGTSSFVFCRDCGYTCKCPNCDIPLTYHRPNSALVCHQCGYRERQPDECPSCQSKKIKYFGLGTEQLADLVAQRWPDAKITRWDSDTTAGRNTHENLLGAFINQEANILVGTQMIAKGLDLPLVTLVGVISADVSLGLPDYRTGERTFQLLAQVAGRAGRGLLGGQVILQTYQPEHYAIEAAADHDFAGFYVDEIRFRTQHGLPPFRSMAKLLFADHRGEFAKAAAEELATELRWIKMEQQLTQTEILGPQPPFFARIGGRFRWQIIIRSPDPLRLLKHVNIPPKWVVDIRPVSLL